MLLKLLHSRSIWYELWSRSLHFVVKTESKSFNGSKHALMELKGYPKHEQLLHATTHSPTGGYVFFFIMSKQGGSLQLIHFLCYFYE